MELRTHFKIMMCIHIMMLILELFFYNLLLTMVLTEMFYMWMCYYNYMTLNKCPVITYIIFVGLSVTQVLRVLDVGVGMPMLLYLCQLSLYAYFGVYVTSVKTKAYFLSIAKTELKRHELNKKKQMLINFTTQPNVGANYDTYFRESR